jgi:hypothetical protein
MRKAIAEQCIQLVRESTRHTDSFAATVALALSATLAAIFPPVDVWDVPVERVTANSSAS